ncbi:oligosaccharide flippase family protein [Pedobacter kyonggii]|uniref:Polysaccharide biosynthesis protein n=1 Tax=Pedobacter kyonggii TaxID=1926871 RepID=A0A4Q9HG53_9SPHI|nr:oligosaccharide flippase family protein [Pedobacter kyonggii]TBO43322.1 polysaccharide biosynthesis protein [Pedobacter kyonggii]
MPATTPKIGDNKRIAKNTMMLYFRMLLTMGVSLYTSRVVLNTLGVSDYGIYNLAGGVTAMFAFLNSSMSGATSRFLTFELGLNDVAKLKKTFSAALTIHLLIAAAIFFLGETVGLWFLENKLIIPVDRMSTARWVYQLSILSTMVTITQVPYNATIIAHERMNVYAYVEILNCFLKLGIVYLLVIGHFDKLLLYAVLVLCISIIIALIYRIYCVKNFPESKYKWGWDKEIIYPMLSFSGWNMYGTMAYTVKTQGVNILLNLFFGVIVNAAYGVATQAQNAVQSFSNNFLTAVNPQIVKHYAQGEIEKMQNLVINASKLSFLLLFLISFPLIVENHFILNLWLKKVPDYAVDFCRLNLISGLMTGMFTVLTYAIFATGKIKSFSIISGTIYVMVLPISYFLLKNGFSPIIPFIINIVLLFIGYMNNIRILNKLIPKFSISKFFINVVFSCIVTITLASLLPMYFHFSLNEGWVRLILVGVTSVLSTLLFGYFIVLDADMRSKLTNMFLSRIKKTH